MLNLSIASVSQPLPYTVSPSPHPVSHLLCVSFSPVLPEIFLDIGRAEFQVLGESLLSKYEITVKFRQLHGERTAETGVFRVYFELFH